MEICSTCSYVFNDTENYSGEVKSPCPVCGDTNRTLQISVADNVEVRSSVRAFIEAIESTPPLAFSAIVKVEGEVPDGEIITLIDPYYTELIKAINSNPEIIYQIDSRRWEEIIAAAYDKEGFNEVILTPRSADLGRDVIAIKKGFGSIKFIDQVKAYSPGSIVTADEVRSLLGVLQAERDASKGIFTTTSAFAPRIEQDKLIKPFLPYRLELVDKNKLLERLGRLV